jgi:hypothetical protein
VVITLALVTMMGGFSDVLINYIYGGPDQAILVASFSRFGGHAS